MSDVKLIPLREDHLEQVRLWRNSKEVSKYMYTEADISPEQQTAWFERVSADETKQYFIIQYGDKNIGVANVCEISRLYDSCNWGFYLGDSSIRGAGVGSKTEFLILDHVFTTLGLNKLRCEVFVWNDAVIRMHEKFGFRREGYFRDHIIKDGKHQDVVVLGILKREWEMLRAHRHDKIYNR